MDTTPSQSSLRRLWPGLLFVSTALLALAPIWSAAHRFSQYYDWRYFEAMAEISRRTVLWYREMPLWNPYSCGGEVDLANPQSMAAAPTFLLLVLFGTALGNKLSIALYLFCAQDGCYRLARRLGIGAQGAVLAALGYGLSGYLAMHLSAGHINFAGVSLYPYLLLFFERALAEIEWVVPLALISAWIALLGGTFTPPMAAVLLGSYATAVAVERRSLRPYAVLLLGGALALVIGAVRMFPALEFIHDHPRPAFRRTTDVSTPLQVLSDLVAWRDFGNIGRKYWSHEYTAKLPYALLPLLLFALPRRGPARRLWALGALFFLLAMGNFFPLSPWSLLQKLPVLRDLRVPSRHLVLVTLTLALLAGLGWDALRERWPRARPFFLLLLGLCALDGMTYSAQRYRHVFTVGLDPSRGRTVPFYFIEGDWRTMREDVFAGHGTLHCDEEAPLQRAESLDVGEVPQERLLDPSAGEVLAARFSPDRRVVKLRLEKDTLLLVNSNWNEHWKTDRGRVVPVAGRLAVDLKAMPGEQVVTLRYAPRSFAIGAAVSALGLPLLLALFLYQRRRRR